MTIETPSVAQQLADAFTQFKADHTARLDDLEKRFNRPFSAPTPKLDAPQQWRDAKSGRPIPVLTHKQRLADLEQQVEVPSVGRVLRGLLLGGKADDANELAEERKSLGINPDPSGGYTVSGILASRWIDLLRNRMVLSQAGAVTFPMEAGQVSIARVVSDPTVSWRAENAALTGSDPTFGAINMRARTVACLVKMSLELAQDSKNIEDILATTITQSMAHAIDSAGLVGVTVDAGAAPSGIFDLSGRNSVTSIGAPTSWDWVVDGMYELLADNVAIDDIGALIAHPAVWKKMRKLKTGLASDNTPLIAPPEVAALPKLWTTGAPLTGGTTAQAIIGDWRSLLFGVRKGIEVRVLHEAFMGSNLQLAVVAYARVDYAATRATDFCTLEGITV